jgi:hypothetical protein
LIERLLGRAAFLIFLLHGLVSYLPAYLPLIIFANGTSDLALLYFYPYALFVFMLLHLPAQPLFLILTDKFFICLLFLLFTAIHFPYSAVPLLSALAGNCLWSYDLLCLRRYADPTMGLFQHQAPIIRRRSQRRASDTSPELGNARNVAVICQMGFTQQEAVEALRRSHNDLQRAVELLLAR